MESVITEGNIKYLCFIILGIFIVAGSVLIILGFSSIDATEIGLDYSWISQKVSDQTFQNGLHYLGVGHSFIKFPKMVQTIEFSKDKGSDSSDLKSRTKDGLEVKLEISFQYTIEPNKLFDLFQSYGKEEYNKVFQNVAIDILTEQATHYTANDFFNKRTVLKQVFLVQCFSVIDFLQLRSVDLPSPFEDAIQQTEVKKQDINLADAQQQKVAVELDTQIKSALFQKNVTLNIAKGNAIAILQQNNAHVEAFNRVQNSQTNAYSNLKTNLRMQNHDLLKMIKTQVIAKYNGNNLAVAVESPEAPEKPLNATIS